MKLRRIAYYTAFVFLLTACQNNKKDLKETEQVTNSVDEKSDTHVNVISGSTIAESFNSTKKEVSNKAPTEQELVTLCKTFGNKKRIMSGNLTVEEQGILRQLRYGVSYLESKYPSYTFKIGKCTLANNLTPWNVFVLNSSKDNTNYALCVQDLSEGSLAAMDNFYGAVVAEECSAKLKALHEGCIGVDLDVSEFYDERYSESLSLDQLVEQQLPLTVNAILYFDSSKVKSPEDTYKQIQEDCKSLGFNGDYSVTELKRLPSNWKTTQELDEFISANGDDAISYQGKFSTY